jgi:hypothetical protein
MSRATIKSALESFDNGGSMKRCGVNQQHHIDQITHPAVHGSDSRQGVSVTFGIIWRRVSELFGARPDIKGMSCVWEATAVSSKLKRPRDLQVILNAAVDETPDEEVGSAYAT